jgi:hypothetical protein
MVQDDPAGRRPLVTVTDATFADEVEGAMPVLLDM